MHSDVSRLRADITIDAVQTTVLHLFRMDVIFRAHAEETGPQLSPAFQRPQLIVVPV